MTVVANPVLPRRAAPGRRPASASVDWYYLPALLVLGVFTLYPLVSGVLISFTDWDGYSEARGGVGLANYARLAGDDSFRTVLANTFVYGLGSTLVQQVLGLALALALNRRMRGRGWLRAIIYLPVLVSPVVMGTFYYLVFQFNQGALNDAVVAFGGERVAWLSSTGTTIAIIVLVNSVQFVGISMVIYLAGLQSIPAEFIEASGLDGASAWQRLRHVVLPLLQPAIATSVVINLIGGLKLFDVIQVLSGGGPGISTNSVSTYIGRTYFDSQSAGYAAAMGVVLFAVIAVLTIGINALLARSRVDQA